MKKIPLIELHGISKSYAMGQSTVHALCALSLTVEEGDFVAIMGPSGSGKSTLLNMLGFLDLPDSGSYSILGRDITGLGEDELSLLRNNIAGFVFQQFQLLPRLSAADNVLLPTIYAGKKKMGETARRCLEWVGMGHRCDHFPNELSGGEQQRVAIARSIINSPMIIFADEPTGNLDTRSEEEIIALLKKLNAQGKTIIMVTHENEVAAHASRIIRMRDGGIVSDEQILKKGKKSAAKQSADSHRLDMVMGEEGATFARAEFFDYVRQAQGSIVSHKLRSLLSMLGILIGVAAVISMVALGEGAKDSISKSLNSLGTNILSVRPGHFQQGGVALSSGAVSRLSMPDAQALAKLPGVRAVSPNVNGSVQAVYMDKNTNTQVSGVSVEYETMRASKP
ncbi:MAG: ATP-binding cassette domain-containing protein, partial [Spirochaetota bacterium]